MHCINHLALSPVISPTDFNPFSAHTLPVNEWEGDTLEITRISRLDMGAYLCIASNGVPPTVSKRIKVSVDCKYIEFDYQSP